MAESAQTQVARLLALLPHLLANPGIRLADVAASFKVTQRQILDDLHVLWFSGLPGHAMGDYIEVDMEAVRGEGVVRVTNADYLAKPLRLGTDEALALLVALRTLALLPGAAEHDAVSRVVAKLERATNDPGGAGRVQVEVDLADEPALSTLRQALATQRRLHIRYWVPSRDETTERDVDPMRLVLTDGRLYLEGWCRLVDAVRLFRVDRISQAAVLDVAAEVPAQARPRDLSAGAFQPAATDLAVTLDLGPGARWASEWFPVESTQERPDGSLRVVLRTSDPAWVVRLALRLGGSARVVDPPEIAETVRAQARAALAAYSPPDRPIGAEPAAGPVRPTSPATPTGPDPPTSAARPTAPAALTRSATSGARPRTTD